MPKKKYVVVEFPLPDGWMSMYIGRLVKRTETSIILDHPCFISHTGRRHLFFAGTPDSNAEWEPSGQRASLPAAGAVVTDWPHDFSPFMVPR